MGSEHDAALREQWMNAPPGIGLGAHSGVPIRASLCGTRVGGKLGSCKVTAERSGPLCTSPLMAAAAVRRFFFDACPFGSPQVSCWIQ